MESVKKGCVFKLIKSSSSCAVPKSASGHVWPSNTINRVKYQLCAAVCLDDTMQTVQVCKAGQVCQVFLSFSSYFHFIGREGLDSTVEVYARNPEQTHLSLSFKEVKHH
ncbi:hypothetical protein BsWGS_21524 [Bradybaena similaris]